MTREPDRKRKKHKKLYKPSAGCIIGRIFAFIGTTLGILVVFLVVVMFILFRGPSADARKIFTLTLNETSAMKWIPGLFLDPEVYDSIINPVAQVDDFTEFQTASYMDSSNGSTADGLTDGTENTTGGDADTASAEDLEIIDLKGGTYKGKVMLIHTPSRVFFGTIDSYGGVGITLSSFLEKYDAIACTNAGGFEDEGGKGKGGIPDGIVIKNGQIVYGSEGARYLGFAGFDAAGVLHVGDLTGREALNMGVVNGTNFANGPTLIKDGVRTGVRSSGINPRTAIGQAADGTVILVAVEGRMADSLGATFEDLTDIMEKYGAINAVNMDGGSSSGMYYEGERITRSCSVIGDRPLPTAILVSR